MTNKILNVFFILGLFSLLASGQENIMVCKNIQNVFSKDGRPGTQITQLQGPPGKRGVQGVTGQPGLPGVQGVPGPPGVVNYEKISEMIELKISQRSYCSVGAGYGGKIPGSSFTASSQWGDIFSPRYGRINAPSHHCWIARSAAIGQWIQVDLEKMVTAIGVMIQGRPSGDQWVTTFHVACGLTASSIRKITDENGTAQLFTGNTDRNTVVIRFFRSPEQCRYLRIYPQTWYGHISMRMGFIESCH